MPKIKKGSLLISDPAINDNFFFKSVILITHHSENESIGLILNQPTNISLNQIFEHIKEKTIPIFLGGPVAKNTIQFLHSSNTKIPGSIKILDGLFWGGDFDLVSKLISQKKISKKDIRFFAGYSGWGDKQLEEEINNGDWLVLKAEKDDCWQQSSKHLWSQIIKKQDSNYAIWTNLPKNPNLN
tara:strand:- start:267 stop:818 length:552 start_codon:yes stop_codon:yes gene_type:complete